jgi:hypothetical protein
MSLILSGTDGLSDVDGSAATPAIRGTDANTGIFFPAADAIAFSGGGVESMRIDANRNVGIGTTIALTKLHVVSNAIYDPLRLESTVSGYERSWTIGPNVGASGQFAIRDTTASANRVNIDSAGNMGLGTTASAWDTNRKAFQIGGSGALWTSTSGNGTLFLSNNTYFDGTNFRYLTTGATTYCALATDGSYAWSRAASGTAGNVVTFTTAMNLDASSNLQFNSGYGSVATAYGCRAWVNFDGTGTVAIRNSGNVSSITDSGVGDYNVNFTNAMPDGNYSAAGSVTASGGGAYVVCPDHAGAYPTGYLRIQVSTGAGTTIDRPVVNVAVFR